MKQAFAQFLQHFEATADHVTRSDDIFPVFSLFFLDTPFSQCNIIRAISCQHSFVSLALKRQRRPCSGSFAQWSCNLNRQICAAELLGGGAPGLDPGWVLGACYGLLRTKCCHPILATCAFFYETSCIFQSCSKPPTQRRFSPLPHKTRSWIRP